jgi:twinkle protein
MAEPSPNYIRHIHESLAGKLWLFDVVGTAKTERILEVFTYAYRRYGVRQFVIDSLMKCGIAEDDYRGQKAFVEALCDFKNTYDVHIHLVAHCRKGESEYQPAGKLDVKGTGAIVDLADNAFNVWRNKAKEEAMAKPNPDPGTTNKPDAILHCHKQRNGEWEGKLPLWFDRPSMQFISSPSGEPYRYIGYSELIAQVA